MIPITIGIAGGTGAGKTTLARKLFEALGGEENVNYLIHDSYYKCLKHKSIEERAKTNFDHPEALDTDLLIEHVRCLKQGVTCDVPTYDFTTHSRTDETKPMVTRKIILIEGILLFCHPVLAKEMDVKVFVVCATTLRSIPLVSVDVYSYLTFCLLCSTCCHRMPTLTFV
jgi:uridine kinase